MRILVMASFICLELGAVPAVAQPVAVLVAIPVPKGMPRSQLQGLFKASVPEYAKRPGLALKYDKIGQDLWVGGSYLRSSRAAAEAWYIVAWKAGVTKRWGAPPRGSAFDVRAIVDVETPGVAK